MSCIIGEVDIQSLLDARRRFEEFRIDIVTERDKTGAIQAFEFTHELAWKIMQKLLKSNGVENIRGPKDCIKEAAMFGIISDLGVWIDFTDFRNLTSHTYDESVRDKLIEEFDIFSQALDDFLENVGYHE